MSKSLSLLILISISLSGCGGGGDGPSRASVEGQVTFSGEPVQSGFIQFIPQQGDEGAPVKLTIKDGKYDTSSDPLDNRGIPLATCRVEITATRDTGKQIKNMMGEMEPESEQYIPAKYNTDSELQTEITSDTDEVNYELVP
ncbi:hypothetical protein [Rubinisphaera italica]|uniref:Carboxypeptidase regulatory-like domain-containing protein n=1 Tax=Rubinisphaera italica TaxID=2527969 RepID=A0A5C5X916_9PLAN|nr:hypothetical protein [Rubinisphaera italica]TWT59328.1 hypothetical protein Pan54_00290 [Rubinisphaera italica]